MVVSVISQLMKTFSCSETRPNREKKKKLKTHALVKVKQCISFDYVWLISVFNLNQECVINSWPNSIWSHECIVLYSLLPQLKGRFMFKDLGYDYEHLQDSFVLWDYFANYSFLPKFFTIAHHTYKPGLHCTCVNFYKWLVK